MHKEIQQRVRYHEYMKSRINNPTYISSSVSASLGNTEAISIKNLYNSYIPSKQRSQEKLAIKNNDQIANTPSMKPIQRSTSLLMNSGSNSLKNMKPISDINIYQKQAHRYNIINMKPIQHNQTIKKYPKFHLEDLDVNFYRKLQLQNDITVSRFKKSNFFDNPQQNNVKNQTKNNMQRPVDNNKQNQTPSSKNLTNKSNQIRFRPKAFNNMDEMQGIIS